MCVAKAADKGEAGRHQAGRFVEFGTELKGRRSGSDYSPNSIFGRSRREKERFPRL